MTAARDLADRFHERWLHANPFAATMYGIPGYDDLLPDASEEGQQAWRAEAGKFLEEATAIEHGPLTPADAVTLDCTTEAAAQEIAGIDLAEDEYTVTAMHYTGPAVFLAVAARTVLVDPAAAEAYLTRLRRSGTWFDQLSDRLRTADGQPHEISRSLKNVRDPYQEIGQLFRTIAPGSVGKTMPTFPTVDQIIAAYAGRPGPRP